VQESRVDVSEVDAVNATVIRIDRIDATGEAANAQVEQTLPARVEAHIARKQAWLSEKAALALRIATCLEAGDDVAAAWLTEHLAVRETAEGGVIYRESMALHRLLGEHGAAGKLLFDRAR
jgi:hypothetical protein